MTLELFMRIPVTVPYSHWHDQAFRAEIESSFDRESERMAMDDEAEFGERSLDAQEFEEILRDLVYEEAVLDAATEDYIEGFARAMSARASFVVALKRRKGDADGAPTRLIDRDVAIRLVGGVAANDDELASAIEDLFAERIEEEDFKMEILEYVACFTDALICDRLIKERTFNRHANRMRREKHGPAPRTPKRKQPRKRRPIPGQGELIFARPQGKSH